MNPDTPTIIFLTVNTKGRIPWLASTGVHALLRKVWSEAGAWLVGKYVIMPDHLHLFAAPGQTEIALDPWASYWKSQFTRQHRVREHRWQHGHWDTRLRRGESYSAKWEYVVENPVRKGLVTRAEDWPFQGEIHVLPW